VLVAEAASADFDEISVAMADTMIPLHAVERLSLVRLTDVV
jgi:hypothetical protein